MKRPLYPLLLLLIASVTHAEMHHIIIQTNLFGNTERKLEFQTSGQKFTSVQKSTSTNEITKLQIEIKKSDQPGEVILATTYSLTGEDFWFGFDSLEASLTKGQSVTLYKTDSAYFTISLKEDVNNKALLKPLK